MPVTVTLTSPNTEGNLTETTKTATSGKTTEDGDLRLFDANDTQVNYYREDQYSSFTVD